MTASGGGRLGGGGIEQKGKRTHGHGPQCSDCGGKAMKKNATITKRKGILIKG